ncbi:SDR family NAD(P)-dependent oxidoreductase [Flagellimonas algicola]|uniref:SDR family oxidoreductase n=1 Tax=Flagellimonas algicola TaxID=2583815 RepID=A0ABY2WJW0_9FLAO|nr:SDR family oxidoreductase [Allomuricauda algicola]TMU54841.1 SDR family oxidoreductase [Allomuricauda algicola]
MEFNGKNVLITGASRGIGKATALAFAEKGAKVGINFRSNTEEAERTLSQLAGTGHQLFQQDVSEKNGPEHLINRYVAQYGQLDILVNNAGISIFHDIEEVDFDHWANAWENIFNTNLFAVSNLCYWGAKAMMASGGGKIVNVSSRGAFRGEPTKPAYGASKAALNSMSQSLAKKLAKHNIHVGVVAPGFTETAMAAETLTPLERENLLRESPFQRMAQPEEVAHAILFLASEGAGYSSGTIIDVNGASYLRS